MASGPPRPRPWPADTPKTVGADGTVRLTAPRAYHIWCGVIGFHVPRYIARAEHYTRGLNLGR